MELSTMELKNIKLISNIKKINKAFIGMKKNTWTVAEAINNIVTSECWKDDFQNMRELGEYIGFSVGSISKMSRSFELMKNESAKEKLIDYTVGQVSELLVIGDTNVILQFMEDFEIIPTMSCKEIREIVTKYNLLDSSTKNEEVEEVEEEVEETEQETSEETEETVVFQIDRGMYKIPVSVLEIYRI